jgi:hypothetical protein
MSELASESSTRRMRVRPVPEMGFRVPAAVARAMLGVVGVLLCLERLPSGFWFAVGIALTGAAVAVPRLLTAWPLLLLLGGTQLFQQPSPQDGHYFLLLAGLHLLHVLAAQTLALPWRGWMQPGVLGRPLLRFAAVQVPVQAVALAVLTLLAPRPDGTAQVLLPAVGIVGGAALVVLTLLLIVPLLREGARGPGGARSVRDDRAP